MMVMSGARGCMSTVPTVTAYGTYLTVLTIPYTSLSSHEAKVRYGKVR